MLRFRKQFREILQSHEEIIPIVGETILSKHCMCYTTDRTNTPHSQHMEHRHTVEAGELFTCHTFIGVLFAYLAPSLDCQHLIVAFNIKSNVCWNDCLWFTFNLKSASPQYHEQTILILTTI